MAGLLCLLMCFFDICEGINFGEMCVLDLMPSYKIGVFASICKRVRGCSSGIHVDVWMDQWWFVCVGGYVGVWVWCKMHVDMCTVQWWMFGRYPQLLHCIF